MNPSDLLPQQRLVHSVALLAAALLGLGVVMWIAANWQVMGRVGQFALLQGLVLATGLGAAFLLPARVALGLLCLLGVGALLAYFGQTYQTGADPWQLFALWAALTLPLCWATRSDVLWAPWALVAATAIALWAYALGGQRWSTSAAQVPLHLMAWSASFALSVGLSPALARYTGAGLWSFRLAAMLVVMAVATTAIGALLKSPPAPQYPLGLLVLALGLGVLSVPKWWDVFAASAIVLGVNVLLIAGLVRWLFDDTSGDWVGRALLIGLVAAGLLAASVSLLMRLSRRSVGATA